MSNELTAVRSGVRSALAIGGLISVVVGIAILVWPTKSATVLAAILGVYTIVAGLSYIGVGLSSLEKSGWGRVGHILLGVLYIIAGVVFFGNLQATTAILIVLITIMIGAIWIVEGVTAFTTIGHASSKVWTIFYGAISIIAGLVLLFSPLASAIALWFILGISAIILGIVQVVRSFTI